MRVSHTTQDGASNHEQNARREQVEHTLAELGVSFRKLWAMPQTPDVAHLVFLNLKLAAHVARTLELMCERAGGTEGAVDRRSTL
jgi:hypothetical protein